MKTLAILLLSTSLVSAHSWYPAACCSGQDCHPVPCEELIPTKDGGYKWGKNLFSKYQVHPSQDKTCHVCVGEISDDNGTVLPIPYCVFDQENY